MRTPQANSHQIPWRIVSGQSLNTAYALLRSPSRKAAQTVATASTATTAFDRMEMYYSQDLIRNTLEHLHDRQRGQALIHCGQHIHKCQGQSKCFMLCA